MQSKTLTPWHKKCGRSLSPLLPPGCSVHHSATPQPRAKHNRRKEIDRPPDSENPALDFLYRNGISAARSDILFQFRFGGNFQLSDFILLRIRQIVRLFRIAVNRSLILFPLIQEIETDFRNTRIVTAYTPDKPLSRILALRAMVIYWAGSASR